MSEDLNSVKVAARAAYYSNIVYFPARAAERKLTHLNCQWFDHDDTQTMMVTDELGTFVVFRGTQVVERFSWRDVLSNLTMGKEEWVMGGLVHAGYKEAVQDVSAMVWAQLQYIKGPIYFCGHSLGGVLATLMSTLRPYPLATFTFGAPRVGDKKFNESVVVPLYRYVYGADIAPHYPPTLLGFRHCRPPQWLERKRFCVPSILDHNVENYVKATQALADAES